MRLERKRVHLREQKGWLERREGTERDREG
jgi:hypothetical protein